MSIDSDGVVSSSVDDAIASFRRGEPVLIHDADDREGETDLVYPASAVTPDSVARMRNDAGGLVCVALSDRVCDTFDLPFVQEIVDHPSTDDHDLSYDERSSFSLTVNHRRTDTGITDRERALTITELAAAADEPKVSNFAAEFRSPGHVHLLRAAPSLGDRRGHTELGIALAAAADQPPAVVVCEMLDDQRGVALSATDARAYAERHDLVFIEGSTIYDWFL